MPYFPAPCPLRPLQAFGPRLLAPMTLGGTHVQQSFRSSGTHVQQCSECRISRIFVPHSHSFKRNSIAASYQHHAGLQPANLVTSSTVSCSRRRRSVLFIRLFSTVIWNPVSWPGYLAPGIWAAVSGPAGSGIWPPWPPAPVRRGICHQILDQIFQIYCI